MTAQQVLEPEPVREVPDGVPEDGEASERAERRILVGGGEPDAEPRAEVVGAEVVEAGPSAARPRARRPR
jgi:hypothetical protein